MIDIRVFMPLPQLKPVQRIVQSPKTNEEIPPHPEKSAKEAAMKANSQMLFALVMFLAPVEVIAASCSSYYISEITLVSPGDTEAGRVQTFVGFGASKEEAEKNAMGSCSHIQLDLETCLASDRVLDRNALSGDAKTSLHLKYSKAVKRITGCD